MLKAQYILKCLISNRRLKSICEIINVPYKYVYSVATGLQNPSANIQTGLSLIIFPSYWHEEADEAFCETCKTEIKQLIEQLILEKP